MGVKYCLQPVGDVEVFYREAGPSDGPVILLLHGFPTSSHMFRELIPELADSFRVIAPDLPRCLRIPVSSVRSSKARVVFVFFLVMMSTSFE